MEQIVIKHDKYMHVKKTALAFLLISLTAGCGFAASLFAFPALFIVVLGGAYVILGIYRDLYVEYEYSAYGNNLSVDKIIGKRRRKHMIDMEITGILVPYDGTVKGGTVVIAYSAAEVWSFTGNNVTLLFSPDERMRQYIYNILD